MFPLIVAASLLPDSAAYAGLASPRYRDRALAAKVFDRGQPAARLPVARAWAEGHPDPEARRLAKDAATKLRSRALDELGVLPYLDACWYSMASGRYAPHESDSELESERLRLKHYLAGASVESGSADPYRSYRQATRLYLEDLLDAGGDPRQWKGWLLELHRRDDHWHKTTGTTNPAWK